MPPIRARAAAAPSTDTPFDRTGPHHPMKTLPTLTAIALALGVQAAAASTQGVVISQVYGGNGNTFASDYVELLNASAAPVSVAGWSVQYASSTGTGHFAANPVVALPALVLQPGQFLLVGLASSVTGAALPAPDVTGTTNLSSTSGKVALMSTATGLACNGGSTLCSPAQLAQIVDLVGYGVANFFEGAAAAPLITATTASLRAQGGCTDTDNNSADLGTGTPSPRNTGSPASSCGGVTPTAAAIFTIQGSGGTSPLVGTLVTTNGVVTKVNNNGYFIQDAAGDGDSSTSDGLFVFTGSAPTVVAGQLIQVNGTVAEFNVGAATNADTLAHTVTELTGTSALQVLGSGFSISPLAIDFPEVVNDDLEKVEGMLVRITRSLTVSQNFFQGRYGQLSLSSGGRMESPTNAFRPGPSANAAAAKNARRRILLDDGSSFQNPNPTPYLGQDNTTRAGDKVSGLVGVIDYGLATSTNTGFGDYKLHPTEAPLIARKNARKSTPPNVGGNLALASFNTLNYFTTFLDGGTADGQTGQGCSLGGVVLASNCRGANNATEFNRQRAKTIEALAAIDADAVALMEMQNNGPVAVQNLVHGVNAILGAGTYQVVPDPVSGTGTDAIKVAMIYKPARLGLVGTSASDTNPVHNRPPLAQTFSHPNGARFTFVANHFKSKSCIDATGLDADQGDLQGCWNNQRVLQAQALRAFVAQLQVSSGQPDVALAGDFNAYAQEDPIFDLTSHGFVDEIQRSAPGELAYSYVFDGASGRLDHLFTTTRLSPKVNKAIDWHINADEPSFLDYNLEFKQPSCTTCAPDLYTPSAFRSSDHDPAIMGLKLVAPAAR